MTTHNEDVWTCTSCHNQFGRHDMYFDGLCEKCNHELTHKTCGACGVELTNDLMHKITVKTSRATTTDFLCESCKDESTETLAIYGMVLGAIILWEDADGKAIMGAVVGGDHEVDGEGHFIHTINIDGGHDEVPLSLLVAFRNAPDTNWIYEQETDKFDDAELDRLGRDFSVEMDFEKIEIHRMVIACINASGEPDLAFVKVKTTGADAVDQGLDVTFAEQWATENDYEGPFVTFNCDHNSAGLSIADNFTWETASVYEGC